MADDGVQMSQRCVVDLILRFGPHFQRQGEGRQGNKGGVGPHSEQHQHVGG